MASLTSLQQFESIIDTKYPKAKSYIINKNRNTVFLEDYSNLPWGLNRDLDFLFETPRPLDLRCITDVSVSYKESDAMFSIAIKLK